MTDHKNIATALATAQQEMGKALKESTNPQFGKPYADLASVKDACLSALNKNGIAVIQPLEVTEGGRYFVLTTFLHSSGESLSCPIPLILGKSDMQGLGSAITYARRFGLMAMAGIAPEDDDGNAAVATNPQPKPKAPEAEPKSADSSDPDALAASLVKMFQAASQLPRVKEVRESAKVKEARAWLTEHHPNHAEQVALAETAALARVDPAMQRPADDKAA